MNYLLLVAARSASTLFQKKTHNWCGEYTADSFDEPTAMASGLVRSVRSVGTAARRLRV
jgi:hypothetical protein